MLEFTPDEEGTPRWTYRPDHRETTYVLRIYGLGEVIELSVDVVGEHEDRAVQASDAAGEVVQELLSDPDLVGRTWGDDSSGAVLPSSAAGRPWQQAMEHAVATFTLSDVGVDQIEEWLIARA